MKKIKFIVERQDGEVTTWLDWLDDKVALILLREMEQKGWQNGTVLEAYIEFDVNGSYYKIYFDCARLTKVLQIRGYKSK